MSWIGSSLDDLKAMPDEVQDDIGYALYIAQCGEKHASAKDLLAMQRARKRAG